MLKQQTKLRVRLYARLSKDDGDADKESNSITNQRIGLKKIVLRAFSVH